MFDTKIYKNTCECDRVFCEHRCCAEYPNCYHDPRCLISPLQHEVEKQQAYTKGYIEGRRIEEELNQWQPKTTTEQEVMNLLTSISLERLKDILDK